MTDMLFALSTMEALNPEWPPLLQSILNIREEMSREDSRGRMAEYTEQEDEIELEQMLVYFLYVYCCTSAYDEQLLAKCKMAVVNVLIIRELWFMRWMENDELLTINDEAELAHWYVREIENSDENMEQWDSLMQRSPRFAIKKILKVLRRGAKANTLTGGYICRQMCWSTWKIQWIEYRIRLLLQMKKVHYLLYRCPNRPKVLELS